MIKITGFRPGRDKCRPAATTSTGVKDPPLQEALDGGEERAVGSDEAVGHAGGVEGEARIAVAVEKDEAASGVRALGKKMDGFARGEIGGGRAAGNVGRRVDTRCRTAKKIDGGFGQDHFHDGFAVAGAGNAAGFGVRVAAAADERRIADAAGKFATSAAGGSGGEEASVGIDGNGADGSLFVAAVMFGGVLVGFTFHPGFAFGFADQFFRLAQLDSMLFCEAFRSFGDEHHVRAFLQNFARELNGILDALQSSRSAGPQRCPVHDDGVTFDVAVQIEVRAKTGIEDVIVFEDHDGGLDGVESGAAARENGPASGESAMAAGFASVNGFVRNIPRAAVNDERWFHRNEDGKGVAVCLGERK